jgi:D-lactate dehydrogenase (cytochrome)
VIEAKLPTYEMPHVRKHASGYFVAPGMDLLDLFIGSEGTLGVITEIEVLLLPKPIGVLSGVVFFSSAESLLAFVRNARERSLQTRKTKGPGLDARAIEYFDNESLNFLRQKYDTIPINAVGAIFFEQETNQSSEDELMNEWMSLLEEHKALADESWFAVNTQDQTRLREFRHQLPVLMNEWFAKHNQRKVSTDMSVPDEGFPEMLSFYEETLKASNLRYTIFGHIGDNHVHVNILPRNDEEGTRAREIYLQFLKRAAAIGGTLSAEHGIGKLKRDYLPLFYSAQHLRQMAALKRAFDPAGILGRGNIFPEEYL